MPNPNARQPGESWDYYLTRRTELAAAEKLMDRGWTPRVLYNPRANIDPRTGKPTPYVRATHGPLTGESQVTIRARLARGLRKMAQKLHPVHPLRRAA